MLLEGEGSCTKCTRCKNSVWWYLDEIICLYSFRYLNVTSGKSLFHL
uniref:Uncharacterized protein n=1 Tax=Anguilla anguilla TaxID=7936 RepID=A0A0E9T787_ANGAN